MHDESNGRGPEAACRKAAEVAIRERRMRAALERGDTDAYVHERLALSHARADQVVHGDERGLADVLDDLDGRRLALLALRESAPAAEVWMWDEELAKAPPPGTAGRLLASRPRRAAGSRRRRARRARARRVASRSAGGGSSGDGPGLEPPGGDAGGSAGVVPGRTARVTGREAER